MAGTRAEAGTTTRPVLAARGLVRAYGGRRVVDIESLGVERGEVLAVLGPNGAGKSTLFRLLLLLERPDAGQVLLDGRPVAPGAAHPRGRVVGVFQRPHLFAGTVRSNLEFGLRAGGRPRAEWPGAVAAAAADLGVSALLDADVRTLSGGEAQRVALARALVLDPDVLLLDEPTANLDVTVRRRFREELARAMRGRARSVLLITHDTGDAFELADRVAVMEEGRVVQVGTPEDLTAEPATPFVAAFTGAELLLDGTVEAVDEQMVVVTAGGAMIRARSGDPELAPGMRVHVRYRPEDVVLARAHGAGEEPRTSARNDLSMRVRSVTPVGGLVRVRLDGPLALAALVTRESAAGLELREGAAVTALLKATALTAYRASPAG